MRKNAPPVEVSRGQWVSGVRITELPDLAVHSDAATNAFQQRFWNEWQIGLLQGLGRRMPDGSYVQLRFSGHGEVDSAVDIELRCVAATKHLAQELVEQVMLGLPEMLGTEPLRTHELPLPPEGESLATPLRSICELRRGRVTIEPEEINVQIDPVTGYSFPWPAGAPALMSVMALLAEQRAPTDLLIDLRPVAHDSLMAAHLRECVELALGEERLNPFRQDVLRVYLERLRDLSVSGFEIRMNIISSVNLPRGLPDAVGVMLSQLEAYVARRPTGPIEMFSQSANLREFRWPPLRPDLEPSDRLVRVWSLREVARVFHIPLAPAGGFLHVASARVRSLPRSPQAVTAGPSVSLGSSLAGTRVVLDNEDLNRHVLIAGLPGFGKSTTVRRILLGLAEQGIPFLVLDPAKEDYAGLVGHLEPTCQARFVRLEPGTPAFNPLSVPTGCSPESHVGRLLAAFDSALQISVRWPVGYALLGRAIAETVARGGATLETLKEVVEEIVTRDGFSGSIRSEILGSLLGRLDFLTTGPLGVALSAGAASVDWADLMSRPTVISLRMFSGPTERSLLFGLLLANLVSYREAHPIAGGLGHVIVLEEAHRVIGADLANSEGSRLFVEALAELRGSGQGFLIVDQAPTELHPLVAKICGTMISHRLVSKSEREAAAASLTLDDRQSEDLAHLERGEIVMHSSTGRMPVSARVLPGLVEAEVFAPVAGRSLLERPLLDTSYCIICRGRCRNTSPELRRWRPKGAPEDSRRLMAELKSANPELTEEQFVCVLAQLVRPTGPVDYFQLVPIIRRLARDGVSR